MGTAWFAVLGVLFVIFQAAAAEESSCVPGFESELLIFKTTRKHLKQGTRLGKVGFSDCTGRTRFLFTTDDSRFVVQTDGVVTVKRQIVLHEGHRDFFIHSWDSQGQKLTVPAMVLYVGHHHGNNHPNSEQHHNIQLHDQVEMDSATKQDAPRVPILNFPRSNPGLKRRKRDWVIPPLNVAENSRGPYPLFLAQIRSDGDKVKKIIYSITGPGADQPPVNLFTMDRDNGNLYVTQELDREKQDKYTLEAHAEAVGGGANAEDPMEIIINVIDQNDNKPVFNQSTYNGEVPEASKKGFEVIKVLATDADQPNNDNSDIRYRIMSQTPEEPSPNMFNINPITGLIILNQAGLDREKNSQYTLDVQVADLKGEGLSGFTKVFIKVTDSNDHAPVFTEASYTATVEENKVDALVVKMLVTDADEPQSPAWNAKFKIIDGNKENLFTVETGTNKQEGIITTAKGLDFERVSKHTLLVTVVNEEPFAVSLITSTATVVVTVEDVNEPPIFDPKEKQVSKPEDLAVNSTVLQYTASDPDIGRKQKVTYKILKDLAGWLHVDKDTGVIKVRKDMDRESPFVKEEKYTALIGAYDDDQIPATGTGTLIITLEDVNDNAPVIEDRLIKMCNKKPVSQLLTVTDKDGPGFTFPYSVVLQDTAKANWTARMNDNKTAIILTLTRELESGTYTVGMEVSDNQLKSLVNTIKVELCDCSGEEVSCKDKVLAGSSMPVILGILGGVLLLLMLVLLLLLLANKNKPKKEQPLLLDNDIRDDIFFYDEEGGGEEDQDYFDLGVLHRGLDNRPHVFRDEVAPVFQSRPVVYKPRPANPEDIGGFIDDNLKAADNDPTAPPYDSLLVFDYEGGGSEAGSISSLNSSSDGDQDYNCLSDWGPRFKKLADMYGGGDDDDMM